MGAYVSLLEYGGIEGMILLSELSRRRIRSVQKLIKVGRQEPVMVLRVDQEKGYIDLSKRRVSPEDLAVSWQAGRGQGRRGGLLCPGDCRRRCGLPSVLRSRGAHTRAARLPSLTLPSPALLPCPPPPEQKCEDRFAKSKLVHSIMRHVAETTGCNLEQLYAEVAWPLYRLYGHAYNAFATMVTDAEADAVFKRLADEAHGGAPPPIMSAAVRDGILNNIR